MDDEVRLRRLRRLSPRQREVLALRCQMRSQEEIAEALVVTVSNVKYHMGKIYEHLELDALPPKVRPIELGLYCPLLQQLANEPKSPRASERQPEPEPEVEAAEQPSQRALVAVDEDERALVSTVRPDVVIYQGRVPEPPIATPPRVSRSLAIVLIAGVVVIAALVGALAMVLTIDRTPPAPTIVSVVVTATPDPSARQAAPTPPAPSTAAATTVAPPSATTAPPTATVVPPTTTSVPPSATPAPPTLTPQPPTPTPRPAPGTVLYQANWSAGLSGWVGSTDWKVSNGMLLNDGARRDSRIEAPFRVPLDDYAVEVELQQPPGSAGWLLVFARGGGGDSGYSLGVDRDQYRMVWLGDRVVVGANPLGQKAFDPGTVWRTYRLEAQGNRLRALIDGGVMLEATDNKHLSGGIVGLVADTAQVMVRSFKVVAL
jgi:hypothetical protein